MSGKPQQRRSRFWEVALPALALFGLTLWLFWPATGYEFVNLDDNVYVSSNPHVLNGLSLAGLRWSFSPHEAYWIPVTWLSYMLDASLFGVGPFGFHFTNLLLHALNSVLVFLLFRTWTRQTVPALLIAALFAWHPLRVESVAWITERKDVLSGFFFLLSLWFYGRHAQQPVPPRNIPTAALVCMLLGLMTKPMLVTLPFVLLLLDLWPFERWSLSARRNRERGWSLIREKIPFFALSIIFSAIAYVTQKAAKAIHGADAIPWSQRWADISSAYVFYIQKTLWPNKLSVVYSSLAPSFGWAVLSVIALAAITGALVFLARRNRVPLVGWLWFIGMLVPVIGFVRVGTVHVADRFTYLPSIGLFVGLAWGVATMVSSRVWLRRMTSAVALLLLVGCAWHTRAALPTWRNSGALFENAMRHAPDSALVNGNYGLYLMNHGRVEESLTYFARSAELNPQSGEAFASYADALLRLGRSEEAIGWIETALSKEDSDPIPLTSLLAFAQLDIHRPDLAVPLFRKALAAQPSNLGWRIELIRALYEVGDDAQARDEIQRLQRAGFTAIRSFDDLIPQYAQWWRAGERFHAWRFFLYNAERLPNHIALREAAAWLLSVDPTPPAPASEAVRLAREAIALSTGPQPNLLATLGAAHAADGQFDQAQRAVRQAIGLIPVGQRPDIVAQLNRQWEEYRHNRPWREDAP